MCAAVVWLLACGVSADAIQRGRGGAFARPNLKRALKPPKAGNADQTPETGARQKPLGRAAILTRAIRSLNLTPQQNRTIREVRGRNDARMRDIGRRFLDGRRQIDEILFADAPSIDRARTLARDLSKVSGERVTSRSLIELELFQVLTPEQRTELRQKRDAARGQARETVRERRFGRAGQQPDASAPPEGAEADPADPPEIDTPGGDLDTTPAPAPAAGAGKQKPARGNLLARMALTPEQQIRFRQMRRQYGPTLRALNFRFRQTQRELDDTLLSDQIDQAAGRRLAEELGRIESDREMARFEIEAAIRQILTTEQAALLRESRRLGAQK